jgi:hypothetical protein
MEPFVDWNQDQSDDDADDEWVPDTLAAAITETFPPVYEPGCPE